MLSYLAHSTLSFENTNPLLTCPHKICSLINLCTCIIIQSSKFYYLSRYEFNSNIPTLDVSRQAKEATSKAIRQQIHIHNAKFAGCTRNNSRHNWFILRIIDIMKTSVSISQMLKGSVLFFTYLITIFVLKR